MTLRHRLRRVERALKLKPRKVLRFRPEDYPRMRLMFADVGEYLATCSPADAAPWLRALEAGGYPRLPGESDAAYQAKAARVFAKWRGAADDGESFT